MGKKDPYREYLKNELGGIIDRLELDDLQKTFMKGRWLDQLLWLENKAGQTQRQYYRLRLITIVGGVIVPALVSLNINNSQLREAMGWGTFVLSQVVAISAAVEEFFRHGDRYRQYRNTAESMKIEGWSFFQLSGPYAPAPSHREAYRNFATNVERLIQKDVEGYISETMKEKEKGKQSEALDTPKPAPVRPVEEIEDTE